MYQHDHTSSEHLAACMQNYLEALYQFDLPLQECHCMLFLTEDNDFRGDDQAITLDEVIESTKGMSGVQQT